MGIEAFYDQDYWTEGKHAGTEMDEAFFRKVFDPLLSCDAVLDYGCGLGYNYQRQLARAVRRYVGVDTSIMAVENARGKGLEAAQIDTSTGAVPLPSETFDGAICMEVFEHLFDPLGAARELNRLLKPDGVLVATVPNFGYHAWRIMALLRAQVPCEPEDPKSNRFKGVHIRFFSKLMLKRLLRQAGFVDIRIGSFCDASIWDVFFGLGHLAAISNFARERFPAFMHLRFLQALWPNVFATRLRAVARKPADARGVPKLKA